MKKIIFLLIFLSVFQLYNTVSAQEYENKEYNAALANKLKADEYGIKKYVMAFLKSGPNRSQDSITSANLQKAHMNNIINLSST